jgi:hypothetical protein
MSIIEEISGEVKDIGKEMENITSEVIGKEQTEKIKENAKRRIKKFIQKK